MGIFMAAIACARFVVMGVAHHIEWYGVDTIRAEA